MALQHVAYIKRFASLVIERVSLLIMSLLYMVAHIDNILLMGIKSSLLYLISANASASDEAVPGGRGNVKKACLPATFKPCKIRYCLG